MNTQRQVIVRDLMDEGKKRIVVLVICVVGLSYLMSLTSSSVWVNLPAAASLIILLRYFTMDYEMRKKAAAYNNKPASAKSSTLPQNKSLELTRVVEKSDWRRKVNSPVVEDAIDHLTRHLVSEWVADLWYSRLTPDKEGPEELVQLMNGVLGEFSSRMRNVNLIDLLTRDLINLMCTHLELFRASQAKIDKQQSGLLTIDERDKELRLVLAAENKLHPALFSAEAEHKVLQHLMDGLISFTFKSADLQCSFFRYVVRELLACAVMRPVLNLASPRFINERIENFIISKANQRVAAAQEASHSKPNGSSRISSDHFSRFLDPTGTGVELTQLKTNQSRSGPEAPEKDKVNGSHISKDPLLSIDTPSSRTWSSLSENSQINNEGEIERHLSGREWGEMFDMMSRRKTAALAPENFENMWTKGRNYRKKEGENQAIKHAPQNSSASKSITSDYSKSTSNSKKDDVTKLDASLAHNDQSVGTEQSTVENPQHHVNQNMSNHSLFSSLRDGIQSLMHVDGTESGSTSSYTSEEEDANSVTGLDSPGTKVWDGKTNRNLAVSHIHHPLENPDGHRAKKTGRGHAHYQRLSRPQSGRKRSRPSTQKVPVWQEIERTSFLSGDGQDILSLKGHAKADDFSDDSEVESLDRVYSGSTACSSATSVFIPESHTLNDNSLKHSLMVDAFYKLRCEVLGANIVKSDSKTFAVYSLSVTDVNNNSWSIKRRFRHFEELHRRLKEYPEYSLHLPPKHFLSTGLDMPVIKERCKLLDRYLKRLLQLPTISASIEVWDFLSVDSQTYVFSNSFSIIETLSVDLDDKPSEKSKRVSNFIGPATDSLSTRKEQLSAECKESILQTKHALGVDGAQMISKDTTQSPVRKSVKEFGKSFKDPGCDSDTQKKASSARNLEKNIKGREGDSLEEMSASLNDSANDPMLPTEWAPPNLTVPILDLIDVIFQLQDGGWIRRQAFWVAKQILQLGMGDALDDWLIEKIQLLRRGSVVASGIKRVEQILWPDGIFITKHPKRRPPPQHPTEVSSPKLISPHGQQPMEVSSPRLNDEQQQQDAVRRAKFVYELMIDNAPAAVVGLVGRKEYEQRAKDLYFFLQSSVCTKQLAFDLLELLLLTAFPELNSVFRQLREEKHKFGEFKPN
uniref:PX domain-containing protein n=1 Tax=Populus davidiana TaxID=266767 RepID=A0A6M2F561_9ROSI